MKQEHQEGKDKKAVILFLVITIVLSCFVEALWILDEKTAIEIGVNGILMWIPGLTAIIISMIYFRKQGILGCRFCKIKYILAGILIPAAYLGISYGIYWLCNPSVFTGDLMPIAAMAEQYSEGASETTTGLVITLLVLIVSSIITAAGEEIGWRGFLLPRMTKLWNFKKAVLISGLIWAAWHMPIMIAGKYMSGAPVWYQLPMFTIEVLSITLCMSILRMKSNSVWPAILLHAAHNYIDQSICMTLTDSRTSAYFVGETGVITVISCVLVTCIVYFIFGKKENLNNQ